MTTEMRPPRDGDDSDNAHGTTTEAEQETVHHEAIGAAVEAAYSKPPDEADERIVTPADIARIESTADDQLAAMHSEIARLRDERDHYRHAYDSIVEDLRKTGESVGDFDGEAFRRLACQHVESVMRDLGVSVVHLWRVPMTTGDGGRYTVTLSLRGGLGDVNGTSLYDAIRGDKGPV